MSILNNKENNERPRRSTGNVKEPGYGYLANGKPNLMPTAGYEGNEPVQYSDENDAQFALRKADFDLRFAHAKQIENGGASRDQLKEDAKLRYEAEIASIDTQADVWDANRKESAAVANSNFAPAKHTK